VFGRLSCIHKEWRGRRMLSTASRSSNPHEELHELVHEPDGVMDTDSGKSSRRWHSPLPVEGPERTAATVSTTGVDEEVPSLHRLVRALIGTASPSLVDRSMAKTSVPGIVWRVSTVAGGLR